MWLSGVFPFVCFNAALFYETRRQAAADHRERPRRWHMSNPRSRLSWEFSTMTYGFCVDSIWAFYPHLSHWKETTLQDKINWCYVHCQFWIFFYCKLSFRNIMSWLSAGLWTLLLLHFGLSAWQDPWLYPTLWTEHVWLWNEPLHWLCFLQRICPTVWEPKLCLVPLEICNLMW